MDEAQLLEYAALAECASSHPISKSLQKAYGKEIDRSRVTDIEELSGYGITATVDGHAVAAGNSKLMNKLGVEYHDCHSTGTIIHMAVDGQYAGILSFPTSSSRTRRKQSSSSSARVSRRPSC